MMGKDQDEFPLSHCKNIAKCMQPKRRIVKLVQSAKNVLGTRQLGGR